MVVRQLLFIFLVLFEIFLPTGKPLHKQYYRLKEQLVTFYEGYFGENILDS